MKNKKLIKRILSGIVALTMVNTALCINVSAVDINRSYRYSIGDIAEDDDSLRTSDILPLQKYLTGEISLSSTQLKTADVNTDKRVTVADLLMVKKCLLGDTNYDEGSINSLHAKISSSNSIVLSHMRDVIGEFIYEYVHKGYEYNQQVSRNYTINGQSFSNCRTDCSTAVMLALYSSGVLDEDKVNKTIKIKYLNTGSMISRFDELKRCTKSGYTLTLIKINNNTVIYPGDILVYDGHTSVVVSTNPNDDGMPYELTASASSNVAVYGAGGDFAEVHKHRLSPELETINQSSSGEGIRPYKYIIRVNG